MLATHSNCFTVKMHSLSVIYDNEISYECEIGGEYMVFAGIRPGYGTYVRLVTDAVAVYASIHLRKVAADGSKVWKRHAPGQITMVDIDVNLRRVYAVALDEPNPRKSRNEPGHRRSWIAV